MQWIHSIIARKREIWQESIFSDHFEYKINTTEILSKLVKENLILFDLLNYVLFDLNELSKYTAFMFMFTPFSSVKLTASNVEYCFSFVIYSVILMSQNDIQINKLRCLESQNLDHFHSIGKKY